MFTAAAKLLASFSIMFWVKSNPAPLARSLALTLPRVATCAAPSRAIRNLGKRVVSGGKTWRRWDDVYSRGRKKKLT